jgi:hypothetical protein
MEVALKLGNKNKLRAGKQQKSITVFWSKTLQVSFIR